MTETSALIDETFSRFPCPQIRNMFCAIAVIVYLFLLQAVSNPDIAARKKIKKHQKMEVKKRKMEFPRKGPKAKKLKPKGKSARDLAILQ